MKMQLQASSFCLLGLALSGCGSLSTLQSDLKGANLNLDSSTYVARHGETLETIAFRYKMTPEDLIDLNPNLALVPGSYVKLRTTSDPELTSSSSQVDNVNATDGSPSKYPLVEPVVIPQAIAEEPDPHSDEALLGQPSSSLAPQQRKAGEIASQAAYPEEEIIEEETFGLAGGLVDTLARGVDALSERFSGNSSNGGVPESSTRINRDWQWPTNGPVAREYDARRPNGRGIDIAGAPGQDVYAAKDGIVTFSGRDPSGVGKLVIVRHDDDYLSIYSHTRDLFVSEHDTVNAGDPIASLGANANDEAMLRFELRKNGKLLNPINYLPPM